MDYNFRHEKMQKFTADSFLRGKKFLKKCVNITFGNSRQKCVFHILVQRNMLVYTISNDIPHFLCALIVVLGIFFLSWYKFAADTVTASLHFLMSVQLYIY